MQTLFISHSDCEKHLMSAHHPESPARLRAIRNSLDGQDWKGRLRRIEAREIRPEALRGTHSEAHLAFLASLRPGEGVARVDADTLVNRHSMRAARLAAGSLLPAVDAVMSASAGNAFCAVRPPGHHAESELAMGFCLFNNVALAARHALSLGAERVAIFDFDVHHGNGTVEIFRDRPEVLVCSSFQEHYDPYRYLTFNNHHVINTPLPAGTASITFRTAIERDWLPALQRHKPDFIFVSAGFDAHVDDPLAQLALTEDDYAWITDFIVHAAQEHAHDRLLSTLEGGYDLRALSASVEQHLMKLVDQAEKSGQV